jgi:hypothetical protein
VGRNLKPQRLLIEQLKFDNIQAFRDERGALQLPLIPDGDDAVLPPSRLQRITGKIYIMARHSKRDKEYVAISEDTLYLLRKQTEQRCPVANMMLASGCAIDVEWLDGSRAPLEDK